MRKLAIMLLSVAVLQTACGDASREDPNDLPRLHALPAFTVSGVSAGAYLAGQLHVAYSADIAGAGLVAGGPWACADGSIQQALGACMTGTGLDIARLTGKAVQLADENAIDDLANLADDRVFVFRGAQDQVVASTVSAAAADWYRTVAPTAALAVVNDVPATHGWPTLSSGAPCAEFVEPWINACDYDLAGTMLEHLLGPLQAPVAQAAALQRFSQAPYMASSMASEGLLYVPARCRDGERCRVHVFLHGCKQAENQIGTVLAEQSGLLPWAEANQLIVLFPQATSSSIAPMNPLGCWDWWGYSGGNYLQKDAPQLAAIRKMVARLQADTIRR